MLGDEVEVGCNSVLNPGTVIGPHSNVYPLSSVRGVIPPNHIFKSKSEIVSKKQNLPMAGSVSFIKNLKQKNERRKENAGK